MQTRPSLIPLAFHALRTVAALILLAGPVAALPVAPGDVLSITVGDAPDLTRKAKVDAGGAITLPLLGSLAVAGLEPPEVGDRIRTLLVEGNLIREPDVFVEVDTWRPVYVGGAVETPGAYPFEPGLTVRQALVLAGGLARATDAAAPTPADAIQLTADTRATAFQLLQTESRIALLKAQIAEADRIDTEALDHTLADPQTVRQVIALDKALLDDSRKGIAAEQSHTDALLALVDKELAFLGQQSDLQSSEQAAVEANLHDARNLLAKGLVPASRVKDIEREALLLQGQMLATRADVARANQTAETVGYTLAQSRTDRRVQLQNDLRAALQTREQLKARLDGLTGQLWAAGMAAGTEGARPAPEPEVTLYRGDAAPVQAGMATVVLPGDVIEISLPALPLR